MSELLDHDATSRTVEVQGYDLHYHEAGEGPAFVLLHGSGPGVSGWSNFKGNLPVFAEHFRTLVLDMPGFGLSTAKAGIDRLYPDLVADALLGFLDELGLERVHLLGNSMGGFAAATFALHHPERVGRMVLMGPGGLAVSSFGPEVSEGAIRLREFSTNPSREAMRAWIDSMLGDKSLLTDELIDERMANAMKPGVLASAAAVFGTFARPDLAPAVPLWARAHEIRTPTLITWGRDDRMLPYESSIFAFRRMPEAELHVFSHCGHWAQVERKADFERLVIEFLTRPGSPT